MSAKSLIFVVLWMSFSGSALCSPAAPYTSDDHNRPEVRSLVAAYSQYADAIKLHGVEGLQKVASPTLTVRLGGQTFQGKEAFAQIDPYLSGLQDGTFLVNILRVSISGDTAVALTEETAGRKSDAQTTITTKRYLKQTWRKTPQSWELEVSEQRPPKIIGETPAITYTVGSAPDALTPLTINMSDPGTGLDIPPPPSDLLTQFGLYVSAASRYNDNDYQALLTPDFTYTFDGKALSHQESLRRTHEIIGLLTGYPGYHMSVNKLFITPAKATAIITEKFSGPWTGPQSKGTRITSTALSYGWTQHWVKTAQGWRLNNITRTR